MTRHDERGDDGTGKTGPLCDRFGRMRGTATRHAAAKAGAAAFAAVPAWPRHGSESTGRLTIVSDRVGDPRRDRNAGSLAVAIAETLSDTGGVWFGWSGEVSADAAAKPPSTRTSEGFELRTLDLTQDELDGGYHGFANQCLWPLLHCRTDLVHFEQSFLDAYKAVNARFADALAASTGPADPVWVHDFHLVPLGAELRRRGFEQPIGFFLHTPFPPAEIAAALPGHREIFAALLAYDVVGFQTENDAACFRAYAERELGARSLGDGRMMRLGRAVAIGAFPTGIDVDAFREIAESAETARQVERLKKSSGERRLIVGVDRLDCSKGLPERLKAYRCLLRNFPNHRDRVMLMQVTPPTRRGPNADAALREELDRIEGEVQGEFADFDWTPLRYIRRAVPRAKLAALYRASRVGLVTPLRDGMNLVAKEYVAAQDTQDPGVLVLSQFAGAAEAMRDAVIVNPYDADETAAAIDRALAMPLAKRRARHAALLETIRQQDVYHWRDAFVDALTGTDAQPAVVPFVPASARPPVISDGPVPAARQAMPPLSNASR